MSHNFPRGKPRAAKHGWKHAQERKHRALLHHPSHICTRCPYPLGPMGPWLHLDHAEDGSYLGFAHAKCNRDAGARKGNWLSRAPKRRLAL